MRKNNSSDTRVNKTKCWAVGRFSAWSVCILLFIYTLTTGSGLLSLKSSEDPIGDPYFTLMEILTLLIATLMFVTMSAVHEFASLEDKIFSRTAFLCMVIVAGITSCVHFLVLTVGSYAQVYNPEIHRLLFAFEWPSLVYAMDILAWDWFFGLSMLFGAFVFKEGPLERAVKILMLLSGILSLIGLIGVPTANMNLRNIGILGYTVVAPVAFLLMGSVFNRKQQVHREANDPK